MKIISIPKGGIYASALLLSYSVNLSAQSKKPNVIVIYADDIGYGDISCNGSKTISTPNVDKVAKEGISFTNAHSVASVSTPSRYSLITGEYAFRHEGTNIAKGDAAMIISPDRFTIADMFKSAGYKTAVVGKWHLGLGTEAGKQDWNGLVSPNTSDLGFDYSFIMPATLDRVPCVFMENGRILNLDPNDPIQISFNKPFLGEPIAKNNPELLIMKPSHGHDQAIVNGIPRIGYMKGGKSALWKDENIADTITAKAIRFIEQNKNEPFFLYFATGDIHVPRVPHPRFVGGSGMGARGDAILSFDWTVGEIMKSLKRLNLDQNTIIVISSDNGPVIDDGYQDKAQQLLGKHKPAGPYRGTKASLFEGGTRIPCIVRWIGYVKPAVSDALMSQVDWFASFASLIGVKIPANAAPDSQNHIKAWMGKTEKGRDYLIEQENFGKTLTISTKEWKYIQPDKDVFEERGLMKIPQLYHLKNDIAETTNLATQHPDILNKLKNKLKKIETKHK